MLKWYDYLIIVLPILFVYGMGLYMRRFIRGVSDFISAGRLCGRYLITVGDAAGNISIIALLSAIEVSYKTGFAMRFWSGMLMPITLFLSLAGYCSYRFRETKAMSIGQFIEMRYSRSLRIFASGLRSVSEILANMIMPALAARFFINFLQIPKQFTIFGCTISSFVLIMVISMVLAISIILIGGMLSIIVTDTVQGLIMFPLLVIFVCFVLRRFSWGSEVAVVMMDRGPGESFINPFDLHNLRDFNFLMFGLTVINTFLHAASWYASGRTVARTAHEQKMAGVLGAWRDSLGAVFGVLIGISAITILNHKNFAPQAKVIRNEIVCSVANDVVKDEVLREKVIQAAAAIPEHHHTYGVDEPLTDAKNLDTPYLNAAKQVMMENDSIETYPPFKTLYHQLIPTITMRNLLPNGLLGLFVLMMILAMISTDDSRIYSAAATLAQDVVLPLKKKPFTPKQHLWCIRIVAIGIGVIFLFGSTFMSQMDYINLFVTIMCNMWLGGCGPVLIFGLYSRFGTTAGAWASLVSGMVLSIAGNLLQRNWAGVVYPWLARHNWVEPVGNFLETVSRPLNPIVIWKISPEQFPINSYEIALMTTLFTLALYCIVSWLTSKEPFNLERMLHRGIYSEDGQEKPKISWTWKNVFSRIIGITPEYSKGDRCLAWMVFLYSFGYQFFLLFVLTIVWNIFSPWPIQWWSKYYFITLLAVPSIISLITVFWFGIGGVRDMIRLVADLKKRVVNNLDDGRVEGNVSLADKERFDQLEKSKTTSK